MTFLSNRWQPRSNPTFEALQANLQMPPFGVQPAAPRAYQRLFEASAKELEMMPWPDQEIAPTRFAA